MKRTYTEEKENAMLVHQQIAKMVSDEGVTCHFTLLGDANMFFADSLDRMGVRS